MGESVNQNLHLRKNSSSDESLDFNNRIIKIEDKDFNSDWRKNDENDDSIKNKISMVNRHRGIIKKEPKVKKMICSKLKI